MSFQKERFNNKIITGNLIIVLLSLFIDIIGFSIIFPMFPELSEYYTLKDPGNPFLEFIQKTITFLINAGNLEGKIIPAILFGGIISAIYSFLQFLFSGFWGKLSDHIGRKPVLLISVSGLTLSYFLWIFSGSFTLFLISRILGGIMGGKISTGTAVVADLTSTKARAKGMALVGMIIGFGFIFGPAIGGLLSMLDISKLYPDLTKIGINPFSMPALVSFLLSSLNLFLIFKRFKETLPKEKRHLKNNPFTFNPFKIFRPFSFKGVNHTIFAFFVFIIAYSGMEFALTFLAVERLGYNSMQNASMFIFAGFSIALIQGIIVRRYANIIGEKRLAISGLCILALGFFIAGKANSSFELFSSLFFIAFGTAFTMPGFSTLLSLLTPDTHQGEVIGISRSLGALGRVFGPFSGAFLFWKYGATALYHAGAISLIIPILLVSKIKSPSQS